VSRVFLFLFLFMSLAVATREIPELCNLADDPSNDGQVLNSQGQTALGAVHCVVIKDGAPQSPCITTHIESLRSTSVLAAITGQDILHLISLLRT
jgi:hypothetical protein